MYAHENIFLKNKSNLLIKAILNFTVCIVCGDRVTPTVLTLLLEAAYESIATFQCIGRIWKKILDLLAILEARSKHHKCENVHSCYSSIDMISARQVSKACCDQPSITCRLLLVNYFEREELLKL